jgi:proline iminopeptidase
MDRTTPAPAVSSLANRKGLYPDNEPFAYGWLPTGGPHEIFYEECGRADGKPAVILHGGPGGAINPTMRRVLDPSRWRMVLFDQRGCGRSRPNASLDDNTTWSLIEDIERLREHLGVEKWTVFGGSWGSTLALAYGQAHPARCLGFVLRGIFLCTAAEVEFFLHGVRWFYPELYEEFVAPIPPAERGDLLHAYTSRLLSDDPAVYWPAARAWSRFEGRRVFLLPQEEEAASDTLDLGVGRLESHYMANAGFLSEDQLVRNIGRIAHLPAVIVQGRYDVICPPLSAWRLHQAWPGSRLRMVADAGHGALESGIAAALVGATEQFKHSRRFD